MRKLILLVLLSVSVLINAQNHPCFLTTSNGKGEIEKLIKKEAWARDIFNKLIERVDKYAAKDEDWLSSRLQMYWNTHATEVYIKGEFYERAGGKKAPAPTVVFTGARGHATNYARPSLDEIKPYCEDPKGMYLRNNTIEGKPYEWVTIGKTGRIIESINTEILGLARDVAFLWWMTGEEKYGKIAASVFDTYATGLYYRNIPVDLNHGHQQTLVGMTSFEVIHEDALNAMVPLYDFLYDYLVKTRQDKIGIYESAFKKCADNIIAKGVPHNNWNLIQARYIMNIGIILADNDKYSDGKGRQYYIDYVLNKSSIRQWSLTKLAEYGFDNKTGIWAECPGYSVGVIRDYAEFTDLLGDNCNYDLVNQIPIITKAVKSMPQYLFPNMMTVGFGDTHPSFVNPVTIEKMVKNAQLFSKREQEIEFTKMLKLFSPSSSGKVNVPVAITSFFGNKPLKLDKKIPSGNINDYVTPLFYSENVSWLVQRNGMDKQKSLMVSLNGSEGNHMHANGISMELYGKGYPLSPDAGIGFSLYQGQDYIEYYSQFPSHNTVCVDGISSYPVMKSNHAFKVVGAFPESGLKIDYTPVTYAELDFIEPETQSLQKRVTGIITTSDSTGYYVDIFRSRRSDGKDKMHDYFYHNLGQTMELTSSDGTDLGLKPTEELAFAGAHLYSYSYLFDKKCSTTDKNIKSCFTIDMKDKNNISMNMWMKGEKNRTVFSALSPATEGLSRIKNMPYDLKEQPTLTYVARQMGEAWYSPFVAVFEPSSVKEEGTIDKVTYPIVEKNGKCSAVAIEVLHKNGKKDLIISSDLSNIPCSCNGSSFIGSYFVLSSDYYFMSNGTRLKNSDISIESDAPSTVFLQKKNDKWYYKASNKASVTIDGTIYNITSSREFILLN